jgi:hypothetical protein
MIRAAKLVSAYLGTVLHVKHVGCRSCWEAELAYNLSRERTTSFIEQRALSRFTCKKLPSVLAEWMRDPVSDWSLPLKLLKHMQSIE